MAVRWRQDSQVYKRYLQQIVILYQNRQDLRMFTEVILSIVAIIVFAIFAIKPTLVTIAELINQQKDKSATIAVLDEKIENLVIAQSLYETQKAQIDILGKAIPPQPFPEEIIRQIEGIAVRNKVEVAQFSFKRVALVGEDLSQTPQKSDEPVVPFPENATEIPASISVKGPYPNLITFIQELEKMRRPFYSDNTKIGINEGAETIEIFLTASGRFGYLKENEEKPAQ